MAVGVDDELQARLARRARMDVGQVEPVRLRVDLEKRPGLERLLDHALDVDRCRGAPADLAVRRMPDAIDVRVIHRGEHPLGRVLSNRVCTDATTQSSVASSSSETSSEPSARMFTSMPFRIRNGATLLVERVDLQPTADRSRSPRSRCEWSQIA